MTETKVAKAATKDNVRERGEQHFRSALNIIKQDIARAKGQQQKAAGEAGAAWKRIEGILGNKKGAQMFASIVDMDDGTRSDIARTFVGLCEMEGILAKDLVDLINDGDISKEELAEMTAPLPEAKPEPDASPQDQAAGDVDPPKRGRGRPKKVAEPDVPFSQQLKQAAEPKSNVTPIKPRGFGAVDGDLDKAGDDVKASRGTSIADEADAFLKDRKKLGIAVPDAL